MISKLLALIKEPAFMRGAIAVISMLLLHFGLRHGLDKATADVIAAAAWSVVSVLLSRAPGKGQP